MTPQRDPYDRAGFRYEPYDITVAGAGLHLFSLVTPDDSTFPRTAYGYGYGYGCTTILRPTPALNWSIACGYCSSGSRSLMKTAGSSTPLAKSAAARS